jgi:hypothetical protein
MRILACLWAVLVLAVGFTLAFYCVQQHSEPTPWVFAAFAFYAAAIAATIVGTCIYAGLRR